MEGAYNRREDGEGQEYPTSPATKNAIQAFICNTQRLYLVDIHPQNSSKDN